MGADDVYAAMMVKARAGYWHAMNGDDPMFRFDKANLETYELGEAEPKGMDIRVVDSKEKLEIDKDLLEAWVADNLKLQLNHQVRDVLANAVALRTRETGVSDDQPYAELAWRELCALVRSAGTRQSVELEAELASPDEAIAKSAAEKLCSLPASPGVGA